MSSTAHAMTSHSSRERLGLLLGFVGMVIFGGTLPATRLAVSTIDPVALTALRTAIAGLCSLALLVVLRRPFPPRELWNPDRAAAGDGRYPARAGRSARATAPVLVDASGPCPGAIVPPWPLAVPGQPFEPPAGCGIMIVTGRLGQDCAHAGGADGSAAPASTVAAMAAPCKKLRQCNFIEPSRMCRDRIEEPDPLERRACHRCHGAEAHLLSARRARHWMAGSPGEF